MGQSCPHSNVRSAWRAPIPRSLLALECLLLFGGMPLACRFSPVRVPALPVLWLLCAYAAWQLLTTQGFDRTRLWNLKPLADHAGAILAVFAAAAFAIWLGVRSFVPQFQWSFVGTRPALWAAVMVGYPVLSVYPQALVYRACFFERYAPLSAMRRSSPSLGPSLGPSHGPPHGY